MLSVSQQWVLEELAEGSSISAAAEEAGVCRQTIYNWLRHDARFAAAVARWRRAHHETVADQLMASVDAAARCVSHAIRTRDARTALALLKGLGFLNGRAAEKARGGDPGSGE